MLLTLDEIKHQCRLDNDFTDEDSQLTLYAKAAQRNIENTIGRKLYATANDVPEGVPWFATLDEGEDIKLALLLLVSHYYANREATTTESLRQIPLGVRELLAPWRVIYPEISPE
ncbi:head-tail connector protein [Vibrio splendidus]|uniref:head-tail connector protein n=1 Tax=Vibrio splendidus TaxID=29497 RepID=UPI001A319830|nr:phage gp6-like head-tail connector protein [Alteromonas sp.]HAS6480589.1 phage gp6-like head-tail connector protein [Vibrio parahaemolyticus]